MTLEIIHITNVIAEALEVKAGISLVLSEKPLAHGFIDQVLWSAGKSIEPANWG